MGDSAGQSHGGTERRAHWLVYNTCNGGFAILYNGLFCAAGSHCERRGLFAQSLQCIVSFQTRFYAFQCRPFTGVDNRFCMAPRARVVRLALPPSSRQHPSYMRK